MRAAALALATVGLGSAQVATAGTVHTDLSEVRACLPLDGGGYLVGTGGGLAQVDGAGSVTAVWTAVDGLPGTRIDGLASILTADGKAELWVGTDQGGAAVTVTGTALHVDRSAVPAGGGGVKTAIWFDGARYLATSEGGLVKLGARGNGTAVKFAAKATTTTARNRARVSSLAVANGTLFVGTAGGLYQLRGGKLELVPIASGANDVTGLLTDGAADAETLWIATSAGLYAREGDTTRSIGGGELRTIARVDGAVVVAGIEGAQRVDRGRLVSVAGAPRSALVQALGETGGAACAGGLDGLWLRPTVKAAWTAVARPAGPPANDISALAVDGNKLWVGTFDHGVALFEGGVWRTITSARLDRRVNALLVDRRDHRVWVATAAGLSSIDASKGVDAAIIVTLGKRDGLPARGVLSLAQLADGRILVGTLHGAAIVSDEGRPALVAAKQELGISNVWAVAQDASGALWLGTTTGLYRGTLADSGWMRMSVATGHLRDDWVMALAPHGDGLWVGTYKGGVTRLTTLAGTAPADVTATQQGDGWINPGGLAWHGDTLYASTMEGLRRSDGAATTWKTVGGVPGKDVTSTARVGSTLMVASRRGLAAI